MHSHLLDSVKEEYKKMSTKLAMIPGGLAKVLQLLDLTVNRSLKSEVRKLWEEWIRSSMYSFTNSGKMKKATYIEVVNWVAKALVKESVIITGFREAEIILLKIFLLMKIKILPIVIVMTQ